MQASVRSQRASFLIIIFGWCHLCVSASRAPSMSCPAVQFGLKGRNITCVTSVDASSISLSRNGTTLVGCNTTSCSGRKGYTGLVAINETHLVLTITIEKVEAHDETTLTCGVEVNGESDQGKASCDLFIYVPPEKPCCNYTFNVSHALVTCSTPRVYPQAKCVWTALSEPKVKFDTDTSIESFLGGTIHLYNTTCTASFPITNRTEYQLNVTFFPVDFRGKDMSRGAAVKTQGVFIIVEPPTDVPLLVVTPTQSEYTESDNVTISCSVLGGRPPVYSTSLHCDSEYGDTTSNSSSATVQGQVVRMNVQLTGSLHKTSCTCSGRHVYPNYHYENTLSFEESDLPVCPKDLQVKHTAQDVITLTWTPNNRDGRHQIYTIIRHTDTERTSNIYRTQVGEVHVTRDIFVEYNISLSRLSPFIVGYNTTNLPKLRSYVFSLDVKNKIGEKECPQVSLVVATETENYQTSSHSIHKLGLTEIVFIGLLPGITVVIIILVISIWKGRRNQAKILRKNNSQPKGDDRGGNPESGSRITELTQVNGTYSECVPAEPNIEHPYQIILPSEVVE